MIQSKLIQEQQLKSKWFTQIDPELYAPADGIVECSYPIYCMDVPVIGVSGSVDWGYFRGWSNQTRELEEVVCGMEGVSPSIRKMVHMAFP